MIPLTPTLSPKGRGKKRTAFSLMGDEER